MIALKSMEDIQAIRKSGDVLAGALDLVAEHAKPGVETLKLDAMAEEYIRDHGGEPAFKGLYGFPGTLCISMNHEVVHGIPGRYTLKSGDLLSVDCGVRLDGFVSDSAVTLPIGEGHSQEALKLLDVTKESLFAAIEAVRVGNHIQDVSRAVENVVSPHGYGIVRELVGHGVGFDVHEEPNVPNYDTGSRGAALEVGLVIAIEPMINLGTSEVFLEDDKWTISSKDRSLSAHFEHTVAVTEQGPLVLTEGLGKKRKSAYLQPLPLEKITPLT